MLHPLLPTLLSYSHIACFLSLSIFQRFLFTNLLPILILLLRLPLRTFPLLALLCSTLSFRRQSIVIALSSGYPSYGTTGLQVPAPPMFLLFILTLLPLHYLSLPPTSSLTLMYVLPSSYAFTCWTSSSSFYSYPLASLLTLRLSPELPWAPPLSPV